MIKNTIITKPSEASLRPPGFREVAVAIGEVDIHHVEVAVEGKLARAVQPGELVAVALGGVAVKAVVRELRSSIDHIGGTAGHSIKLWIDDESRLEDDRCVPDPAEVEGRWKHDDGESLLFIKGKLLNVSVSFIDQRSPVIETEPNGTIIEDHSIGDYFYGGDGEVRFQIGGDVFTAVNGEYHGFHALGDDPAEDCAIEDRLVDASFTIEGEAEDITEADKLAADCEGYAAFVIELGGVLVDGGKK